MLRKASETISEGNGPIPQQEKFGSGQPTLAEAFREIREKLEESHDEMTRLFEQLAARLEQGARQRRYAMEADETNTKTREGTEGAAIAVQAMRGDSCTTEQKVQDGPKISITFGVEAEPFELHCRDDVLVEGGDAAPRSCLPSLKMRSPTTAGGLLPTGEASTATWTTSNEPLLRFYATEEMNPEEDSKKENVWTSTPYVSYDSSVFREGNLSAAPYCRRVGETKPRKNRTFDPGGSQGPLHACPFLGSWRVLVCGDVIRTGAAGDELQRFTREDSLALFKSRPA